MVSTVLDERRTLLPPIGAPFVSPFVDVAFIGGGLSLALVFTLYASGILAAGTMPASAIPVAVLLANVSHFGASTVRLYTKPGAFEDLPGLTMVLPLATLAVLTLAIAFSSVIGVHLYALYLTWSPYHYAAQAYGLAAMYAMRSGRRLADDEQRLLWWACMLPFVFAFLAGVESGLGWVLPSALHGADGAFHAARLALQRVVGVLALAAPIALAWRVHRLNGVGLPVISILLLVTNGIWWVCFPLVDAFVWATVFHGVQYLAIVTIFHLRDHQPGPGRGGRVAQVLWFYALCLGLGYVLFEVWPYAYVLAGFTLAESMLLCSAVINIHHFIVDRGIWRLRRDRNYRIVVGDVPA
jgi:hypothetical protein